MLKNFGFTLIVLMFFFGCINRNATDPLDPSGNYFPLQAGNTWQYTSDLENPTPGLEFHVSGPVKIGKFDYYLWGTSNWTDTLRLDSNGDIWQYTAGKDLLRFAFSLDDQATYFFPGSNNQTDAIQVQKNQMVDTPAGRFMNCIKFIAGLQVIDGPAYTFAPGIGLVALDGWAGYRLVSAEVNGKKLGTH